MTSIVFYELASGAIEHVVTDLESTEQPVDPAYWFPSGLPAGRGWASDASNDISAGSHYVVGGVVTPRQASPVIKDKATFAADGADSVTFSNIPTAAVVSVHDLNGLHQYEVLDGELIVTASAPQTIQIRIETGVHLPADETIVAT